MAHYFLQRYPSGIKAVLPEFLHLLHFTLIGEAGRPWWKQWRRFGSVLISSRRRAQVPPRSLSPA